MKRRSGESTSTSVTLFPFLAVLICTMGVMIILLVVASKAAEVHQLKTNAAAIKECDEQQNELDFALQESELKIQALIDVRPQLQEELEQARLRRSHIENELRKLEERFKELNAQARELAGLDGADPAVQAGDLEQLQVQIDLAKRDLEKALRNRAATPTSYAIVTHPSINGTLRRPIYVECGANTITLQPSGIVIQTSELQPPILPGNPLDTALLAVREYWMKLDLAGEHGEPYPLLIVRPEGAQSYALVREAMQSWNDEFGYELIESDKKIEYGPADPPLTTLLQTTIATARAQYAELRRAAVQTEQVRFTGSRGGGDSLRVSREGGFETVGGSNSETNRKIAEPALTPNGASAAPADQSGPPVANAKQASGKLRGDGTTSMTGSPSVAPLANSRGANWALPKQNDSATAYRRPIVVKCAAQSLTIDGGDLPAHRQTIPIDDDIQSVDQFVHAVWQVMETWGIAERNGYWKPELRFVVEPDGRATFERIQMLLDGCGFDIRRVTMQ